MPRWEPHPRLRFVEAALELFEQQGYNRTSVAQIAERAGLTRTTFFRHFLDKREVLFAGQESHSGILSAAVARAPELATPLEAVGAALDALASTFPADRQEFASRLQAVIDGHGELRERAALKRASYVEALTAGLLARSVPGAVAAVAADLGVLAFFTAYSRWVASASTPSLARLTSEALREIHLASEGLR